MDRIVGIIAGASSARARNDDDFIDRLSSRYSVIVLVAFAIGVSLTQHVGTPITCWAPVHFTGSHTRFANNYCWVRNTYYLPWEDEIPRAPEHDKRQTILYYQWIPFILLGQALCFYIPSLVWHGLNSQAGVDSDNILSVANRLGVIGDENTRARSLQLLANQVDRFLQSRRVNVGHDVRRLIFSTIGRICGRRLGNYLVILFMFSKLCYIGNAFGQLFMLNRILSTHYNLYGFEIMKYLVSDHDWTEARTVAFPRVTMCDFRIRRLGNVHRYTVQCVLPINLYIEKIYMFLWFWIVFVVAASVLSFFTWLMRSLWREDRLKFVRNHLQTTGRLERQADKLLVNEFIDDYLRQDGAFLLRLIAHNTSNVTTTEVICKLWDNWKERRADEDASPPDGDNDAFEMQPLSSKFA